MESFSCAIQMQLNLETKKKSIEVRLGTNNAKKSIRLPTLKLDQF